MRPAGCASTGYVSGDNMDALFEDVRQLESSMLAVVEAFESDAGEE